jgi:hypothetical protein
MATEEEKMQHARALLKIEVLREENDKFRKLLEEVAKGKRQPLALHMKIQAALAGK